VIVSVLGLLGEVVPRSKRLGGLSSHHVGRECKMLSRGHVLRLYLLLPTQVSGSEDLIEDGVMVYSYQNNPEQMAHALRRLNRRTRS